jgi:hypothetical protein
MITSAKASLATSLLMFENTVIAMSKLKEFDSIFLELSKKDLEEIKKIKEEMFQKIKKHESLITEQRVTQLLSIIKKDKSKKRRRSDDEEYFDQLLKESRMYKKLKEHATDDGSNIITRFFGTIFDGTAGGLSKIFGDITGSISVGEGKMKKLAEKKKEEIKSKHRPLDTLLDKVIPGHFGHVAIWVGSEKELKERGLWEHPLIKPHQEEIKNGKQIIEALRSGVQMSSLDEFMNIDDFAVVSNDKLTKKQKATYITDTFANLGKDYDFNFEIKSEDKIYCSEMVYHVYTDYTWPRENTLDRATISPDQVISRALAQEDFKFSMFFHEGKEVTKNQVEKMINELIEAEK